MLPRVEYIHWIQGRPERAAFDLGSSDLRDGHPEPNQVVPPALTDVADPDPDVGLGAQVAETYGVEESQVVVTAGASHAYVLAVAAALDAASGDEDTDAPASGAQLTPEGTDVVLVERPGYEPLRRVPEAMGATLHRFRRTPESGYALSPDRVAAAVEEDTALVVATNRHNPTGRLADRETLAAAASAARTAGSRLLVDEVYAPYTATARNGPFGGPTAAGLDGAVVVGSLTKFQGLGGLRIGWIVADEPFLGHVRNAFAYLPVRAAPSEALARRAFASREAIADRTRNRLRANHERLRTFVEGRDDVEGTVRAGSPFAFLAHESADGDAVVEAALARDLLVVPGRFFEDEDRFRVSLGGEPGEMDAALDVLGATLDAV